MVKEKEKREVSGLKRKKGEKEERKVKKERRKRSKVRE